MKVHFLGIGGSGASAAAALAQAQGFKVTGCDIEPHNEFTTDFKKTQLFMGHSPAHLYRHSERSEESPDSVDILAVTPAIFSLDAQNPELLEAKRKNIPIMTWQQFLGEYLTKGKFVIAVCGTHGKTTTTAMIAKILEDDNLNPTVELGAIVPWWKTNYRVGEGNYFVVEADEFNDNFLHLKPDLTVVTNIEMDHPEYFKDLEAVKESFKKFLLQTKGTIVANLSDPGVKNVILNGVKNLLRMQDSNKRSLRSDDLKLRDPSATPQDDKIIDYSKNQMDLELKIPGEFNKLNALAALKVGLLLGIDTEVIKNSLQNYPGVSRRFEYIGVYQGAKVYSDFGHHPTEIKVTMEAAREKFPKSRILLIYQPHMFSRTKALFDDFVSVFKELTARPAKSRGVFDVDKTFIMDIYPSREVDTGLVSSKQLVKTINNPSVLYIGKASETLEKLKSEIKKGDILFFMSAGDTDKLAKDLTSGTFSGPISKHQYKGNSQ